MKKPWPLMSFLLMLILVGCSQPRKKQVHLFVPCGMLIPLQSLKPHFTEQTGLEVDYFFENADNLLKQIRRGARPDVLITPGVVEMKQMLEEGYIIPESVRVFGTYKLALIVPARNKAGIESVEDLAKPSVKQIAIADPEQNSVGYYAREALKNLGLWASVQDKIVDHRHAVEAVKYVLYEMVDAGIYYSACPFQSAPEKLENRSDFYRFIADIPPEAYPKVKIQAGLLKEAKHPQAGKQFIEFLLTPEAQRILAEKGLPNYEEQGL